MNEFDSLMNELGVKPIKKKKGKDEGTASSPKKEKGRQGTALSVTDAAPLHPPKKEEKKKKEFESESFEEALKIYTPNIEENNNFHSKNTNMNIFKETFSNIEEEEIMHTIDLHGKTLDEAISIVKERIVWCYREKLTNILVITGKGNHSDNGPILKIGIKSLLIDLYNLIEKFEYAPKILGGEGAYLVKIRL
jgi:DNA-nicking Smr family endonuclease